ncbi:hypothetical protein O1Q96_20235 [Streptomyces sp. Qhu-G9]|uniref:hypothetical protein n=1 Tax=Streptomyces sp. Qhu-G9 TaxID=3452799 RepID=UPI0022ABE37F|nr:hypothetical protein [Streptomyces aurantiacus]WAU81908.1 hypothetical protein O1Q96_20235 [Streptomyces aurantiacus]
MLPEVLVSLAASGGGAVVQAAGTDAWSRLSSQVARWLGRGDAQSEQGELERLRDSASELVSAGQAEHVRLHHEALWQERIERLLETLGDLERRQAAEELRGLLHGYARPADDTGPTVGRDVNVRADNGSIAANVLNGGAHIGLPPMPDPSQG